jgi:hypothetical protein
MDLISRARTNTPVDSAFVYLRPLFLFSWGGNPWAWAQAQAIGGDQIQGFVTHPTGAAAAGAIIEADRTDSGLKRTVIGGASAAYISHGLPAGSDRMRVSKTGFKTYRLRYNRLGALSMRCNVELCDVHREVVQPWRL